MSEETIEKNKALVSIFGEEKVEAAYQILGREPVSMATLKNFIRKEKIKEILAEDPPSVKMAKELGVHISTLYRI